MADVSMSNLPGKAEMVDETGKQHADGPESGVPEGIEGSDASRKGLTRIDNDSMEMEEAAVPNNSVSEGHIADHDASSTNPLSDEPSSSPRATTQKAESSRAKTTNISNSRDPKHSSTEDENISNSNNDEKDASKWLSEKDKWFSVIMKPDQLVDSKRRILEVPLSVLLRVCEAYINY
jgi:hypothetical protein